jgi:hypothetical protein
MENAEDDSDDPIMPGSKMSWAEVADLLAKEEEAKNQRSAACDPAPPTSAPGEESAAAGTASAATEAAQPSRAPFEPRERQLDATPAFPSIETRPNLVVLCWQPLTLGRAVPAFLRHFADEVKELERHLDARLPRLAVWRPEVEDLERLRYQLRFRDAALIQETLAKSADDLFTLEIVAKIDPRGDITQAPMTVVTARAQLLAVLAENGGTQRFSERLRSAIATYQEMVERDLIAPLQRWALSRQDPILQNAAMEFAELSAVIHRTSPLLHDALVRRLAKYGGAPDDVRSSLMQEFLQNQNRYCSLAKTINRL